MIVDRVTVTETDGGWLRTARVSGRSGELTLEFMVPHVDGASLHTGDAAGFLAATLLPAMLDGEDLHIDAPVSATTLAGCTEVVTAFARWEHRLRPPRITTAGAADPQPPGPGTGCCFSRGADSMVSAVVERPTAAALTHLVHVVGLEPVHSPATLAEEVRLARHVGDLVGLPVVVPQTNVRRLTDGRCDWADAHGVALAALAGTAPKTLANSLGSGLRSDRRDHRWLGWWRRRRQRWLGWQRRVWFGWLFHTRAR